MKLAERQMRDVEDFAMLGLLLVNISTTCTDGAVVADCVTGLPACHALVRSVLLWNMVW